MSWIATAVIGSAVVGGVVANKAGKAAAKASEEGAQISADAQREALEYLKQTNALPLQMRDQALRGLGAAYLPPGSSSSPVPYRAGAYDAGAGPETYYGGASPVQNFGIPGYLNQGGQQQGAWDEEAYLQANPDVRRDYDEIAPNGQRVWDNAQYGELGRPYTTYDHYLATKELGEGRNTGQSAAWESFQEGGIPASVAGGEGEPGLSPDWMYDRAISSGLYEGLAPKSQEELLQQAEASPLYKAIMSGQKQGEESILRNVSATGNLRSGGSIEGLVDYNTNLQNRALLAGYGEALSADELDRRAKLAAFTDVRGGVSALAQTPTNENTIASLYSGIGETQAAGTIAAGQARQSGYQNAMGNVLGIAGLGIQAKEAGLFSDLRLKENIEYLETRGNLHWYRWDWTEDAKEMLGLEGGSEGVLAHQVFEQTPEAVSYRDGFLTVDYDQLELGEAHA